MSDDDDDKRFSTVEVEIRPDLDIGEDEEYQSG